MLYRAASTNISADTLDAVMLCDSSHLGAQFSYNPLIFPEEKMDRAETRFRELAQKLIQDV